MSTLRRPLLVAAAALLFAATPAKAQLWYNGNWNGSQSVLPSERDLWVADTRIYDNFLVAGSSWNVTTLFADFLSDLTPSQAYWEIRSGVSVGNGGSLLYSGTSSISWLFLGAGLWGDDLYRATVSGLSLTLPVGTYWLAIAPAQNAYGRAYIAGTNGTNGVNALLDGNSYWDSQTFGKNFTSTSPPLASSGNFAYGVGGTAEEVFVQSDFVETETVVTPEPGSLILLATGLGFVGLGVLRRRRPTDEASDTGPRYLLDSHSRSPSADGIVEAVLPEPRGQPCPTKSSSPSLLPGSPPSCAS